MYEMAETPLQALVGVQEIFHFLRIASEYRHELSRIVLHTRHQRPHSIFALLVLALPCRIHRVEVICLIQEEYASHRFVDGGIHILRRLVHVLAYDIVRDLFCHPVCRSHSQSLEYSAEGTRHTGLSRAGISCQDDVESCQSFLGIAQLNQFLLHGSLLHYEPYRLLNSLHTDESVQLLHYCLDSYVLRSILAHQVRVAQSVICSFSQTQALHSQIEEIPDLTGVAESIPALEVHPVEYLRKHLPGLIIKGENRVLIIVCEQSAEYLLQFSGVVVGEFYGDIATGRDARIHADEIPHFPGVTRHNADKISLAVFKKVEQSIDRIHSVTSLSVPAARKSVGLVDEEHSAHCLGNVILHIGFGVALKAAYEIFA